MSLDPQILKACEKAGQAIKTLREACGLNRAQLAERLKLSPSFVGYIEDGKRIGSLETYINAAAVFGSSLSDLFEGYVPDKAAAATHSISLDGLNPGQVLLVSRLVKEIQGKK